jgi:integrase
MAVIKLTPAVLANLKCPEGKRRVELCDSEVKSLYLEVREASPGTGTYYLRYSSKTDAVSRHVKLGTTEYLSLADARKRARELKAQVQLGADFHAEAKARKAIPTLKDFFDETYTNYARPRKRSFDRDVQLFRRIDVRFGSIRLNELNKRDVQGFLSDLIEEGLAPASVNHHGKLLRALCNVALDFQIIQSNPLARLKLLSIDNRKQFYLQGDDLSRLMYLLRTDANRTVCGVLLFLLATGARQNEALTAKWADIDRVNRTWRIPATISKNKRIGIIPLNDLAMEVLDSLPVHDGDVFWSPVTQSRLKYINKVWNRIRKAAGMPTLRVHDLRHAHASLLVASGQSIVAVQALLRHQSVKTTQTYVHLDQQMLVTASKTVSDVLKAAMTEQPNVVTVPSAPLTVAAHMSRQAVAASA